jgi:hypothetical protein
VAVLEQKAQQQALAVMVAVVTVAMVVLLAVQT